MKKFGLDDFMQFKGLAQAVARKREEARADELARNATAEIAGMIERCEWMRERTGVMQDSVPTLRRVHTALGLMLEDLHAAQKTRSTNQR